MLPLLKGGLCHRAKFRRFALEYSSSSVWEFFDPQRQCDPSDLHGHRAWGVLAPPIRSGTLGAML